MTSLSFCYIFIQIVYLASIFYQKSHITISIEPVSIMFFMHLKFLIVLPLFTGYRTFPKLYAYCICIFFFIINCHSCRVQYSAKYMDILVIADKFSANIYDTLYGYSRQI